MSARGKRLGLGTGRPSRNFGVAFADGLRQRSGAVYHASPPEGGRGREAGASAAYIDDARVLDSEAGFLESGVELFCRKRRRRRLREFHSSNYGFAARRSQGSQGGPLARPTGSECPIAITRRQSPLAAARRSGISRKTCYKVAHLGSAGPFFQLTGSTRPSSIQAVEAGTYPAVWPEARSSFFTIGLKREVFGLFCSARGGSWPGRCENSILLQG